jgi:DNA-binding PadR family transcriptional regulator
MIFNDYFGGFGGSERWAGRRGGFGGGGSPFSGRPGGFPDWLGDLFGPPPRADRGGVRYLVLDAIAQQPRHGYEVIQAIEQRSGGTYRPSPGVVYPTLQLLEELGHARVIEQDARKVYAITAEGERDLAQHREEVDDFYDRSVDHGWERQLEDFSELAGQVVFLLKSFKRAVSRRRLSPDAQRRIREVLAEAIGKIEAIVAEELRRP